MRGSHDGVASSFDLRDVLILSNIATQKPAAFIKLE